MRCRDRTVVDLLLDICRERDKIPVVFFCQDMDRSVRKAFLHGSAALLHDLRRVLHAAQPQDPDIFRLFCGFPLLSLLLIQVFLNKAAVLFAQLPQDLVVHAQPYDLQ